MRAAPQSTQEDGGSVGVTFLRTKISEINVYVVLTDTKILVGPHRGIPMLHFVRRDSPATTNQERSWCVRKKENTVGSKRTIIMGGTANQRRGDA